MPSAVDVTPAVVARLAAAFGPARIVYSDAVPSGTLPDRYVLVESSVGEGSAGNLGDVADSHRSIVYVTCTSRDPDPARAAREAKWAAVKAVSSLLDWQTWPLTLGSAVHHVQHLTSSPVRRDDALPDTVMFTTDQFSLTYQP